MNTQFNPGVTQKRATRPAAPTRVTRPASSIAVLSRVWLVLAGCGAADAALAQYRAVDLTPPAPQSIYQAAAEGNGNTGGIQVGAIGVTAGGVWMQRHAALWSSTLDSVVDLTPGTNDYAEAFGTDGSQEVGYLCDVPPGAMPINHAALWTGSAVSFVDLHPLGYADSVAYGCSGGQQAGWGLTPSTILGNDSRFTLIQGGSHALMWNGTAASVVDLNPQGFLASISYGIENGVEVGSGVSGQGVTRALRWTGTPESYVDITPATDFAGNPSMAFGIQGGQTLGYYTRFGALHAALWTGPTADTLVDLHPPQFYRSVAYAAYGGKQVGWAILGTGMTYGTDLGVHALLWSGTADSMVDLHPFLPQGFGGSLARGIGADGTILVEAGPYNPGTNSTQYLNYQTSIHTFLLVPSAPPACAVASVSVDQTMVTLDVLTDGTELFSSPVIGTVTLTSPAPPGGALVRLLGRSETYVTVPEGATNATFLATDPVLVNPYDYSVAQNISASYGGITLSTHYITIGTFPLFDGPVRQGLVGQIQLATPVDADEMVTLISTDTNLLQVPNKVVLKAGMAFVEYPVTKTPTNVDVLVGVAGVCSRGSFSGETMVNGVPPPPAASVSAISPATVPAGAPFTMTLTGLNFIAGAQVLINGVALPSSVFSQSSMAVDVPASAIPAPAAASVQVLNPGSTASTPVTLTVTGDLPVLTAISPDTVSAGSPTYTLTLSGSSFYNTSVAMWQISGGTKTALTTTYVSPTTLTAVVPATLVASAGKAQVFVNTPADGSSLTALPVTILSPISLSSISPNTVLAATAFTMTLKGANFINGAQVNVNGTLLPATLSSSAQMTAVIPGGAIPLAGSVPVYAVNPGGAASGSITLNLQNPVPQVASLSPSSVKAGSATFTLTINGTNFVTTSQVRWNGSPIATTYVSATQLQATIPAANLVKTGNFKIDVQNPNPGGGGSNGVNLSVN